MNLNYRMLQTNIQCSPTCIKSPVSNKRTTSQSLHHISNHLSLTSTPLHSLHISSVPVLSLFTIVQFQNQGCAASSGDNGTCLTTAECSDRGGVASGPCANGYGVCCVCKSSHFICGKLDEYVRSSFVCVWVRACGGYSLHVPCVHPLPDSRWQLFISWQVAHDMQQPFNCCQRSGTLYISLYRYIKFSHWILLSLRFVTILRSGMQCCVISYTGSSTRLVITKLHAVLF